MTILDPRNITTNAFDAKRSAPLLASGVVLHALPQGARFDLVTRILLPFETHVHPLEAAEIEEAVDDLRQRRATSRPATRPSGRAGGCGERGTTTRRGTMRRRS